MSGIRPRVAVAAALLLVTTACSSLTTGTDVAPGFPSGTPTPAAKAAVSSSAPPSAAPSPTPLSPAVLRQGPTTAGPWHQVFADDFAGDQLNQDSWVTCYDWNDDGCTNAGQHELEWYQPQQVSESGGALLLSARKTPTWGSDQELHSWTSGMVSTGRSYWDGQPRFTLTYGYIAAAIQLPSQSGMFPGFWLMPSGSRSTPPELDIMEGIGSADTIQMTLHWAGAGGADVHSAGRYGPVDYTTGYHVFAVDWEPHSVTWYIDGVERYQVTDTARIPKVPMEILLNLAVGYPRTPPAGVTSATMKVDWIRAWQH